jgi:hypothetical protein
MYRLFQRSVTAFYGFCVITRIDSDISLNRINQLIFVMVTRYVFFEV